MDLKESSLQFFPRRIAVLVLVEDLKCEGGRLAVRKETGDVAEDESVRAFCAE